MFTLGPCCMTSSRAMRATRSTRAGPIWAILIRAPSTASPTTSAAPHTAWSRPGGDDGWEGSALTVGPRRHARDQGSPDRNPTNPGAFRCASCELREELVNLSKPIPRGACKAATRSAPACNGDDRECAESCLRNSQHGVRPTDRCGGPALPLRRVPEGPCRRRGSLHGQEGTIHVDQVFNAGCTEANAVPVRETACTCRQGVELLKWNIDGTE